MDPDNLPKYVELHKNHKYKLKLGFYAAPSNPKTFSKAVRDELDKLKFTYCSDLKGLIMGFGRINSKEDIQADIRHCMSIVINVDVYIFRPPVGSIIEAIVNQTSDNHVSCLVHNLFNVSIVRPENQPYDQWPGHKVYKDDKINVKVLSFDLTKKLPHITGHIVDNEKNECYTSKDEQDNNLANYSSSTEGSVCDFLKSMKHIQKDDTASSSKMSMSGSESCDEENSTISHSKNTNNKSSKVSPLFNHTTINNNPLFSSTPVSSSENSVNNINLIKNKQLEQLHKHLVKYNLGKQIPVDSVKSHEKFSKGVKNNDNNGNEFSLIGASIDNNDNSKDLSIINQESSLQSDSSFGDKERKQFSIQNSFSNASKKSTKTKKNESSEKNVTSILHLLSPDKKLSETNRPKHTVCFNSNHSSNDEEENSTQHINNMIYSDEKNSVYTQRLPIQDLINSNEENSVHTQHAHDCIDSNEKNSVYTQHCLINSSNSDDENLFNYNIPNKPLLKFTTKSIRKSNTLQNKDLEDKNEKQRKTNKNHSNITLAMISSDSESNNEDPKLSLQVKNHEIKFNKEIKNSTTDNLSKSKRDNIYTQNSSSSDDEIYTKIKQNISKLDMTYPVNCTINDNNNLLMKNKLKKQNESLNNFLSNEKTLLKENKTKLKNEKSILLRSPKRSDEKNNLLSNVISKKKDEMNIFINKHISKEDFSSDDEVKINNCNINKDNNLLALKKEVKQLNKTKKEIDKSILQSPRCSNEKNELVSNLISKKDEIINHILKEDSRNYKIKCDNYIINKDNNLLPNKKKLKKLKKTEHGKNESILQPYGNDKNKLLPNVISKKKDEINKHILKEGFNSDDEVKINNCNINKDNNLLALKKEVNKTKKEIDKSILLQSPKCSNKKNELMSNLISKKDEIINYILKEDSINDEVKNDNYNLINKDNNLIPDKKKLKKTKHGKNEYLQSPMHSDTNTKLSQNVFSKKDDMIKQILDEDTRNDDKGTTDNYSIKKNKKKLKKQNKINHKKNKSIFLQSPMLSNDKSKLTQNVISKKNEIIKQILDECTSSDNELKANTSNIHKNYNLSSNTSKLKERKKDKQEKYNSKNLNVSSYKNILKKQNKTIQGKDISMFIQSPMHDNHTSELSQNLIGKEEINKNEIIRYILKENSSNDDEVKGTTLKSNITDEYKLPKQNDSNKMDTSNVLQSHQNNKTFKNSSNPFIKLYAADITSSSSEDDINNSSIKLKDLNIFSKKKNTPLIKQKTKKDALINEVLKSLKHKNKSHKHEVPVEHIYSNSLEDGDKLTKVKELEKYKSKVKNKKDVLKKLKTSMEEQKLNKSVPKNNNLLKLKIQPSTDDSTDDEIDVIKQIMGKKRKLSKTIKTELPELTMKNNISKQLNKSKTSDNLKSQKSMDELINNIIKTKRRRLNETKDLLLDGIMNSMDDSSSSLVKKKKKKKENVIETNDGSDGSLSIVKKKKKKSKL